MGLDPSYYRDLLRRRLSGRKVVIAHGFVAALDKQAELLRDLGAAELFVLAEGIGAGTADLGALGFDYKILGTERASTLMEGIRAFEAACADPPAEVLAALDRFDPAGEALVIRALWGTLSQVAGRPVWGARQPAWLALEDKVVIDELWDRVGVPRAPYRVVEADPAELSRAARELDRGAGTVWAGDSREGWHGGGEYTRWVPTEDDAERAAAFLSERCDRVRVMPFLEGIPCSIHGIVLPDHVVALRPVEMVTLRVPAEARLRYFGCATSWDPPDADREEMRSIARRVGAHLREEVGYRGTFTIDGVMTADGFRPSELNPRYGAGMEALGGGVPELPLYHLDLAIAAGEPWDFRPRELEELILTGADANRTAGCRAWDRKVSTETEVVDLAGDSTAPRRAAPGEEPIGSIMIGPAAIGSFLRIQFRPDRVEQGASIGPSALAALAFSDLELGTHFGRLEAARPMRR